MPAPTTPTTRLGRPAATFAKERSGRAAPAADAANPRHRAATLDGDDDPWGRAASQAATATNPAIIDPPWNDDGGNAGGSSSSATSWDYFDRLRETHVDPLASSPSDVHRVPAGDIHAAAAENAENDTNDTQQQRSQSPSPSPSSYYDLRHLVNVNPLLVNAGDTPRQTYVEMAGAAVLALHHFNNGISDAVPELASVDERCGRTRFTMDFLDSLHRPIKASEALLQDVLKRGKTTPPTTSTTGASPSLPVPTAVIGAYRSAVSGPLATLGGVTGMPQFSAASTSTDLDNRDRFPLFGRTVPSAAADAAAAVDYFNTAFDGGGVSHFGVLHIKDSYGTSFARALQVAGRDAGMSVTVASLPIRGEEDASDPEVRRAHITSAIEQLKRTGVRYFFGVFFYEDYEVVMSEAYRQGIAGHDYFWVFGDGLLDLGQTTFDASSPSGRELIEASRGSAVLAFAEPTVLEGQPHYDALLRHWRDDIWNRDGEGRRHIDAKMRAPFMNVIGNEERVERMLADFQFSEHPSSFVPLTYNIVVAAAFAVCDAEKRAAAGKLQRFAGSESGGNIFDETSIESPPLVEGLPGEDVIAAFVNVTFQGVYGKVSIDPKTGSGHLHTMQYSVSNLLPDESLDDSDEVRMRLHPTLVRFSVGGGNGNGGSAAPPSFSWRTLRPFVFPDGTTRAPASLPPLEHDPDLIPTGALIAGYVMCATIILTSITCFAWTFRRRERRVIKAAQPVFLFILASGALLMGSAIIPLGLQEPGVSHAGLDVACNLTPWLITVGFSLMFSALFAKEIRIAKLMLNKDIRRIKVTAVQVMKPALILVGANAIIMAVWMGVAPFSYDRRDVGGSVDAFGRPTKSRGMCVLPPDPADPEGQGTWWVGTMFVALVAAVNGCAMLSALYQVYLTRRIKTEFSESKFITLSMMSIFQAFLVGIPLIVVGRSNGPTAMYVLVSVLIFIVCQSILTLIFVPKVYFMREWKKEKEKREQERIRKSETPSWAKQESVESVRNLLSKVKSKRFGASAGGSGSTPVVSIRNLLAKVKSKRMDSDTAGNVKTDKRVNAYTGTNAPNLSGVIEEKNDGSDGGAGESSTIVASTIFVTSAASGAREEKVAPNELPEGDRGRSKEPSYRRMSDVSMDDRFSNGGPAEPCWDSSDCDSGRVENFVPQHDTAQRRVSFVSMGEPSFGDETPGAPSLRFNDSDSDGADKSRNVSVATMDTCRYEPGELRVGFRKQKTVRFS